MKEMISWKTFTVTVVALLALCLACPAAFAAKDKPNILVVGAMISGNPISARIPAA